MSRAIVLLTVMLSYLQSAVAALLPLFARHDFEIWDQEINHRIMSADTGNGLRETSFQYDARARNIYSLQGLYNKSGVLRIYDLDAKSVDRFTLPVSRSPDYWACAIVRRKLFILGIGDSLDNSFYKGRGNKLFAIQLNGNLYRNHVAGIDIGKSRIGIQVMPLSDSDVCVIGLDVSSKSFFIETYDAELHSLKNLKMFPKELTGRRNGVLCTSEKELASIALHIEIPMSAQVSPAMDKICVMTGRQLLILNSDLGTEVDTVCSFAEFGIKDNGECCVSWIDSESIVGFDPNHGDWFEYNVNGRQVVEKGCVVLEAKDNDRREYIRGVLGRRKFYVSSRNGCSRVCTLEEGRVNNSVVPRLTYLEYFAPDVVVIDK